MKERFTLLMTSGAGPGVVGHIDAARNNAFAPVRIVCGDVSDQENAGFALADDAVSILPADDPKMVGRLLDICRAHGVDVLWPVYDGELESLAAARERFEAEGVHLLMADADTIRLCLDKAAFYKRLNHDGCVLPYRTVASSEELHSAAEALGYPNVRLAIKPVRATGGRGFHVIDAKCEAGARFLRDRPDATTCRLQDVEDALSTCGAQPDHGMLVMPYVDGDEYGCDALAEKGRLLAAVTRRKLPPVREGMHTRIIVEEDARVIGLVSRVVEEIGADGLLSVDVRQDADGALRVLEINPRAGAYLGMACTRIDLFGMALARLFGERPDVERFRRSSGSIVGVRYWSDLVHVDGVPRVLAE